MEKFEQRLEHTPTATQTAEALCREAYVFGQGLGGGVIREIQRDPTAAAKEVECTILSGIALSAAAAADLPVISTGALGAAAYLTGKFVVDTLNPYTAHNQERNAALANAWQTTWRNNDRPTLQYRIDELQQKCGPRFTDFAGSTFCH